MVLRQRGSLSSRSCLRAGGRATRSSKPSGWKRFSSVRTLGGNDGANNPCPYWGRCVYTHRPHLGIPKNEVRRNRDIFGFSGGMADFQVSIRMANWPSCTVAGPEPLFSNFTFNGLRHTRLPTARGIRLGRPAGGLAAARGPPNSVNIAARPCAVRSTGTCPRFDDPNKFFRKKFYDEKEVLPRPEESSGSTIPRGDSAGHCKEREELPCWCREAWDHTAPLWIPEITGLDLSQMWRAD